MDENTYVLLDLVAIDVTTVTTESNTTIVFCKNITVKKREYQTFDNIKFSDWSNIIIGDPKYNEILNTEPTCKISISELKENNGEYEVEVNGDIGLWSVVLFETSKNDNGYEQLTNISVGSGGTGGVGTGDTGVKLVYYTTDETISYTGVSQVNDFLKDVLGRDFGSDNDKYSFNGCIYIDNTNCGMFLNISPAMFNEQTNLKGISLTNTIVYISESGSARGVFSNCDKLKNANIPIHLGNYKITKNGSETSNTTRSVPGYYFYKCKALNNIIIPDGIHDIGYAAFYGCDNVETINIPSSVKYIRTLSLVTLARSGYRYINVIDDTENNDIRFYYKSVGYNKPTGADKYNYIQNAVFISIKNRNTVTLLGDNAINDTSFIDNIHPDSRIYIDCKTIEGVEIGSTINSSTQFYQGGFIGTTFDTIYIGPNVETICDFAFYNVRGTNLIINNDKVLKNRYETVDTDGIIEAIEYGDDNLIKTPFVKSYFNKIDILNCSKIGDYALHSIKCTNKLTFYEENNEVNISDDLTIINNKLLTSLSDYAFYNSYFGSITIPSSVTNISNTSFLQTSGSLILNCDISDYETNINQNPRNGILINSRFSKINFNYAGIIPKNILYENKSINLIELGEGITKIHEKAFYLCTNLTGTLTIPSTLTQISSAAFIGCRFSEFETSADGYYQADETGMYLLAKSYFNNPNESTIVLFANRHASIQIVDHTFDIINIESVTGIGDYAFAYAFSGNSTVYAVNIPKNIKHFGSNVFYNSDRITRITFFASNVPDFDDTDSVDISVPKTKTIDIDTVGSFIDLPLLTEVYVGYKQGVLLSDYLYSVDNGYTDIEKIWFLHNTLRKSNTNKVPSVDGITIYVYKDLVDDYINTIWDEAGYTIAIIPDDIPSPDPPTENDDEYDADIDDPEGEEWPGDGGNGNISDEEDHIPPIDNTPTEEGNDNWVVPSDNNGFNVAIKQLGTPAINVYGCRLDLLNLTDSYSDERKSPIPEMIVDQFGNIDFSALDYLKFNKVSNETHYGSENDKMLKLYMGDYGNNFLIVFTVTGIDKFDATTKLFTSGVEYATHRESNWLKTEIVRITKKPESDAYYVVLLCTCLKLQNKDNYNCRSAIVSVNYGSQILDTYVNGQNTEGITTKIRVIQHKTELRLSNDTKEINITDLPTLFCQTDERAEFFGYFFIGFPKNFWSIGNTINIDDTDSNKNKLREYINDYFRILYDKEKIKVIGQKTKIGELDYTYTFDVADDKYANIKSEGSTTGVLKKFDSCSIEELNKIHEEYYYVNFKIENLKTSLAGGVWNISIYNIGEPAEMLNIHAVEDKTDIPSVSVLWGGTFTAYDCLLDEEGNISFNHQKYNTNECYVIDKYGCVRLNLALPAVVTGIPTYYTNNVANKIYPSIEIIDLCVDTSVVHMCGMSLLGNNTGNIYNAFTTYVEDTTLLNMGISSNRIRSLGLNNVKFKHKENLKFKSSLYNFTINSGQDRETFLADCSRTSDIVKVTKLGAGKNEILENSETYIYYIDTGYSSIKDGDNTDVYKYYLSSDDQGHMQPKLSKNTIGYEGAIKHLEKSETDVYIEANNVLTDTYYDVLAPLHPYVNIYMNNGITTIDINESVKLTDKNLQHYYCAFIKDDMYNTYDFVVDDSKNKLLYILKDNTYETVSIWDTDSSQYIPGLLDYELDKNVYAFKCFRITDYSTSTNSVTVNLDLDNILSGDNFDDIIDSSDNKNSKVIEYYSNIEYVYAAGDKTNTVVYERGGEYYDIDSNENIEDINEKNISISNIYTPQYYIYISEPETYESIITTAGDEEIFVAENGKDNEYYSSLDRYIKYDGSSEKWYKIYNPDGIAANYTASDDFYIKRDYDEIKETIQVNYTTKEIEGNKRNITPKNKSGIHPELFRQIFYHLYYKINDNGTIIKVYDDNDQNSVLHLRLMKKYYPSEDPNTAFSINNVLGIYLGEDFTVNGNLNWHKPNGGVIFKP